VERFLSLFGKFILFHFLWKVKKCKLKGIEIGEKVNFAFIFMNKLLLVIQKIIICICNKYFELFESGNI